METERKLLGLRSSAWEGEEPGRRLATAAGVEEGLADYWTTILHWSACGGTGMPAFVG